MSDLDAAFRAAQSLEPDEQLQLIVRLWKSLPRDHRAALVTLQLDDSLGSGDRPDFRRPDATISPFWRTVKERLFDRSHASGLYSAPRRFDLATIFVVTAAYSLLLGAFSAFGAPPIVMVVFAGLIAIIATAQALFLNVASPRGVSIVAGAIAYTLFAWGVWLVAPNTLFFNSFFLVTFINGIPVGAILGYLLGTVIGGVFLVADMLRGRFEGRAHGQAEEGTDDSMHSESPFVDDPN